MSARARTEYITTQGASVVLVMMVLHRMPRQCAASYGPKRSVMVQGAGRIRDPGIGSENEPLARQLLVLLAHETGPAVGDLLALRRLRRVVLGTRASEQGRDDTGKPALPELCAEHCHVASPDSAASLGCPLAGAADELAFAGLRMPRAGRQVLKSALNRSEKC